MEKGAAAEKKRFKNVFKFMIRIYIKYFIKKLLRGPYIFSTNVVDVSGFPVNLPGDVPETPVILHLW